MIDTPTFYALIGIMSAVVFVWTILTIYRRIRYEAFLLVGYILLIMSLSLTGEYSGIYFISAHNDYIYQISSLIIASIALFFIIVGLFSSNKRWIKKRGTNNLNSFRNLAIFAYMRHPITYGSMLISISLILLIHSILSNVFAGLSLIILTISSFERDSFLEKVYGYPYKVYTQHVPRFNIIHGIIRSFIVSEKQKGSKKDFIIYD